MGCGWDIERNLGGWLCLRQSALCTGVRWEELSTGARGRDGNARRFHGLPGIRCGSGRNAKAPTRCWISRRDLCRTLVSRVAVLYACTEDRDRKSVVKGMCVSVRVDLGGRRFIKNKISSTLCMM